MHRSRALLILLLFAGPVQAASLQTDFHRGVAFTAWQAEQYASADAEAALAAAAEHGVRSVSILVTLYQATADSTEIASIAQTPSDAALRHIIRHAHDLGLSVLLKVHIDVLDGTWRGWIRFANEADWNTWFANYQALITRYAELAEAEGVGLFTVGTELRSTESRAADWRTVVAAVRAVFSGELVYAANHDSYMMLSWWDALDAIGVDAYFALTGGREPTEAQLRAAWESHLSLLETTAARFDRPVLITEIGYRSVDGANIQPWLWGTEGALDFQEQADCYTAALEALWNQSWCAGLYWWDWRATLAQGGLADDDYTPLGKPAGAVLRNWYAGAPTAVAEVAPGQPASPVAEERLVLSASASTDPDGEGLTAFAWTQTAGPAVWLDESDPLQPAFVPPAAGVYTFAVRVTDARGVPSNDRLSTERSVSIEIAPRTTWCIRGRIERGGQGVGGAWVDVLDALGRWVGNGQTGPAGSFTLGPVPAGSYHLLAYDPGGFALGRTRWVRIHGAHAEGVSFVFPPGYRLAGAVRRNGAPVPGAWVDLYARTGRWLAHACADSAGTFAFFPHQPGEYELVAYSPETLQPTPCRANPIALGHADRTGLEITLPPGHLLGGSLQRNGQTLSGVWVDLFTAAGLWLAHQQTDPAGAFRFTGLHTGSYRLVAYQPRTFGAVEYGASPVLLRSDQDAVVFEMP